MNGYYSVTLLIEWLLPHKLSVVVWLVLWRAIKGVRHRGAEGEKTRNVDNVSDKTVVVVVRLEHSHRFINSFDNHSTASGPASCRRRSPPGNAVSGHSSTMCLVVWWLSPQGQAGDAITPHR